MKDNFLLRTIDQLLELKLSGLQNFFTERHFPGKELDHTDSGDELR